MPTQENITVAGIKRILGEAELLKKQLAEAEKTYAEESLKNQILKDLHHQLNLAQQTIDFASPRDVSDKEFIIAVSQVNSLRSELFPKREPEIIATGGTPPRGAKAGGDDAKQDLSKPNAEYAVFASTGDVINVSVKNGKSEISVPTTEGMSVDAKVRLARDFIHIALMEGAYSLGKDDKPHFNLKTHDPQFAIAVQKQAELLGCTCDIGNVLKHAALYKNAEASPVAYNFVDSYIGKKLFGGSSYGEVAIGKQMGDISSKVVELNKRELQDQHSEIDPQELQEIIQSPELMQKEIAQELLTTHSPDSLVAQRRLGTSDRSLFSPSRLDDAARFVRRQPSVSPLQRKVSANLGQPVSEKTQVYTENLATMGIAGYNYGSTAKPEMEALEKKLEAGSFNLKDLATLGVARAKSAAPRQAPAAPTA